MSPGDNVEHRQTCRYEEKYLLISVLRLVRWPPCGIDEFNKIAQQVEIVECKEMEAGNEFG